MLCEIAIGHLEELIDEGLDLLGHLAVRNEGVRCLDADLEQHSEVGGLDLIELFNDFKYHVKAMIQQVICLPLELLIAYEYPIIRVHMSYVIRECVLSLTCEIANHGCVNAHLQEMRLCTPFMVFKQIQHNFNQLEEIGLRIARDHH